MNNIAKYKNVLYLSIQRQNWHPSRVKVPTVHYNQRKSALQLNLKYKALLIFLSIFLYSKDRTQQRERKEDVISTYIS